MDIFSKFLLQKGIYGPYGTYFPSKCPYMDRTDHIFLVQSPYMDPTDHIFLVESPYMDRESVHSWKRPHIWTLSQSISGYFINRGRAPFLFFPSPYFINRGGLLTGGGGYPTSFTFPWAVKLAAGIISKARQQPVEVRETYKLMCLIGAHCRYGHSNIWNLSWIS